jgi:hypothetical protein
MVSMSRCYSVCAFCVRAVPLTLFYSAFHTGHHSFSRLQTPATAVRPRLATSDSATPGPAARGMRLAFRTSRQGERAIGRTGARARARGDQAGGYWCVTGRSVGLSVHDQRCPACPDRAKAVRRRSVPLPKSSSPAAARDAWRRRPCDLSDLAHSETAQAVRVRILSRLTASVTYHTLRNASGPKTPPVRGSAKLPPLTFHHTKIALVHVTESRVPMHQVLHDWGGRRS